MTRVHKDHNYTQFISDGMTLAIRRIFHPTRGEEAQIEVSIIKVNDLTRSKRHKRTTFHGSLTLLPAQAADLATPLMGHWRPPAQPVHVNALSAYLPKSYDAMSDREKGIALEAFEAGRAYQEGLKP